MFACGSAPPADQPDTPASAASLTWPG